MRLEVNPRVLEFVALGVPRSQGSKSARIMGKRIRYNGELAIVSPRVQLLEQSDMQRKTRPSGQLTAWRTNVAQRAKAAAVRIGWPCLARHCRLSAEFVLSRPDGHWTKANQLTAKAQRENRWPGQPDLSKLMRAIEDAMSGIVYEDDRLIAEYGPCLKRYGQRDGRPGVRVRVEVL